MTRQNIYVSLIPALVWSEWSASRQCRFTLGERALSTRWIGGSADPRDGLDNVEKWKFLTLPDSNVDS
jgi:hypothetical protein